MAASHTVGFGMNARGAMGIYVLADLARGGLLKDQMFVALVFMALATSLVSGPAMKRLLYGEEPDEDVVTLLRRGVPSSASSTRETPNEAIAELVRALGSLLTGKKRLARDAVLERELVAAEGLGNEVAIPPPVEGLDKPLLAARSFDSGDRHRRARRAPRALRVPLAHPAQGVRRGGAYSRVDRTGHLHDARARANLVAASGIEEVTRVLSESAKRDARVDAPSGEKRRKRR